MTDDAVVWKVGFGAMVLAFCGLTVALRKPPPPEVPAPPAAAVTLAAPAPLDAQDEAAPVRIEVDVAKPKALRKPLKHAVATRVLPPRIHRVVATRAAAPARPVRAHYPYDPRDRWVWRERP